MWAEPNENVCGKDANTIAETHQAYRRDQPGGAAGNCDGGRRADTPFLAIYRGIRARQARREYRGER